MGLIDPAQQCGGSPVHPALKLANIDLDRKVLADIAMHEGEVFKAIVAQAKAAPPKTR